MLIKYGNLIKTIFVFALSINVNAKDQIIIQINEKVSISVEDYILIFPDKDKCVFSSDEFFEIQKNKKTILPEKENILIEKNNCELYKNKNIIDDVKTE